MPFLQLPQFPSPTIKWDAESPQEICVFFSPSYTVIQFLKQQCQPKQRLKYLESEGFEAMSDILLIQKKAPL